MIEATRTFDKWGKHFQAGRSYNLDPGKEKFLVDKGKAKKVGGTVQRGGVEAETATEEVMATPVSELIEEKPKRKRGRPKKKA